MDFIQIIKEKASAYKAEVIAIRQHLHQNPELSFQEFKTAEFIESKLNEYGITNQKRLVKTGIIALIEGKNPTKKIIALRSDHDALPILETNEVDYKSVNNGVMHACGHDVHTSSLLGVAKILNELKNEFEGTVKLVFQPGEEIIPGGASLIIKEGGLENPSPSKMFGQHVYPQLEAGKVGFRPGMYMASADEIYVTVKGKGGHAALPQLNVDPILIASHIIVALQQIVSRSAHPTVPTVLSFGKIIGEGATNVIPDEVKIEGTFRTMNEEWRAKAHQKMKKMAEDIAEGMGGECVFDIHVGYPFLVNDEELTARAKQGAIEYLGTENVVDLDLRMTAEDFAFYSQILPTCFYRLGVKNDQKQINSGLHTSTFNVDEDALETGMGLMAWLTVKELQV
ncbi:amidohydrolase [Vicingus serpentipes]|uniref:Amidohydrolase n=1 Tax=Vicingus serpentipes TaxID=1926625 RepID=A0A5C6RUJ8_9FLAO|nr:M20 family metallopeptidase [Vicingus serpentipes]TXB65923.1 amidohydrolase [Vicingus serpentipes]